MEIRMAKITLPAAQDQGIRLENQGTMSWWLEHLLAARIELNLPSSEVDAFDNVINSFLGSVLMLGLQPPPDAVRRLERGAFEVSSFLLDPMTPRIRRYRCRIHGSLALLVHGLHGLSGADVWGYRKVAGIGYDCFMFASNTFGPKEYDAQIFTELAMNFERYSLLLNGTMDHIARHPTH